MTYNEFLIKVLDALPGVSFLCYAANNVMLDYGNSTNEELKACVRDHYVKFNSHIDILLREEQWLNGGMSAYALSLVLFKRYNVGGVEGRKLLLSDMMREANDLHRIS